MADDFTTGPMADEGVSDADADVTPGGSTPDEGLQAVADGQSGGGAGEGKTDKGTPTQAEDIIYNPDEFKTLHRSLVDAGNKDLADQLTAFQKSLQGTFTKKTQALAQERAKIEAYDAWNKDPMGQLQTMAERMGYTVSPRNAQQGNQGEKWTPESGAEPESWNQVIEYAENRLLQKLAPALNEVSNMRKSSIETQLSEIDPSWQTYEPQMMEMLNSHPTLAHDPAMLYRMAVPSEVLESRATQAALRKLEAKTKSSNVSGGSSTTKTPTMSVPDKPMSFNESVQFAKQKLASQGLHGTG